MITLAIDTSTPHGSVALLADDALLFDEHFIGDRSHSASLFVALEKVRAQTDRVDQIAIGLGPGSYAGVRIAIAAALGLRLALDAKLAGIPSVAALETDAPTYIVIGDARRDSFYFSRIENGVCVEGPLLATEEELKQRLGSCAALPIFATEAVLPFPAAQIALPSAALLARLAAANRGIIATENLEPIYLREPHITQPKQRPGIPPR
ncbi:peptidase M22 glycoprotease [Chthoniobacter flavus Ellin428]|uniref:Peptidase M22 glycoprotease n=1 Tax=Chthoniobacter flavus Ellin428 TaxID=497964 RepID=B4D451_9BACT|nr:tRNA (adenosine(37)-N6)-threonylcarbamoyltransferase complex dimerization subunit type 1 TsaB [Chthoniobacter flavus]EDY18652.1 peptidase M22 glycoprotease [Chthoniobacter flavus Ellin428]TCO89109.1 tRNA threonylcarbamoyladenosine biosynthesis protein TsaB [Chthoniobacter flavus]